MIKVHSVILKENASGLQKLSQQIAQIEKETAEIEKELGYHHSVFEDEIFILQKRRMKIAEEKEAVKNLSGKLQEIASLYEETEQRVKTEAEEKQTSSSKGKDGTKAADDKQGSMSELYERNQPDDQNITMEEWINELRRTLNQLFEKRHGKGLLVLPPLRPIVVLWIPNRVVKDHIDRAITALMK